MGVGDRAGNGKKTGNRREFSQLRKGTYNKPPAEIIFNVSGMLITSVQGCTRDSNQGI